VRQLGVSSTLPDKYQAMMMLMTTTATTMMKKETAML